MDRRPQAPGQGLWQSTHFKSGAFSPHPPGPNRQIIIPAAVPYEDATNMIPAASLFAVVGQMMSGQKNQTAPVTNSETKDKNTAQKNHGKK